MLKTTLWAAVLWAAVNSMAGGNRALDRRVAAEGRWRREQSFPASASGLRSRTIHQLAAICALAAPRGVVDL
jgi:hypothetical protein